MNVLALQGGGCLGYGQALTLAALESSAGKPCHEIFDMIGGTSVGCINAAVLSIGVSAGELEKFYTRDAPNIFHHNWIDEIEAITGPKYPADKLEAALISVLGFKTMADCLTKFVATAYDYATDRPVYFISYEKSWQSKDFIVIGGDSPIQLWQICRASSAAQTYFPAYACGDMMLMDGGNAGDNAPDVLLAIEAHRLWGEQPIKMLSIGSGDSKWDKTATDMQFPSKIRAGLETIEIVFSAGESAAVFKAGRMPGLQHYRMSPDLGAGIDIDDVDGCLKKIPPAVLAMLDKSKEIFAEFDGK